MLPRRHVPTWFDASTEERAAITAAIDQGRELLASRHHPDGFNIGINVGEAAGQTVFHLHVHLIPRYSGDVADPRGGVRHVIPCKGRYPAQTHGAGRVEDARWTKAPPVIPSAPLGSSREESAIEPPAVSNRLVSGGEEDPLYRYLREELAQAATADIAVGFVMPSGLQRLEPHLRDFLARNGRLRLLTGDYLGVTEPEALIRLLDLEGDRQIRVFETAHPSGPEHPGPPAPLCFHPKAYGFERKDGTGVAFVGSSNLSESALQTGIEWNYRVVAKTETAAFREIRTAFDSLFDHPATRELTQAWIDAYRQRRPTPEARWTRGPIELPEEPATVPTPHPIQQAALEALEETREQGNTAGLVVRATPTAPSSATSSSLRTARRSCSSPGTPSGGSGPTPDWASTWASSVKLTPTSSSRRSRPSAASPTSRA